MSTARVQSGQKARIGLPGLASGQSTEFPERSESQNLPLGLVQVARGPGGRRRDSGILDSVGTLNPIPSHPYVRVYPQNPVPADSSERLDWVYVTVETGTGQGP